MSPALPQYRLWFYRLILTGIIFHLTDFSLPAQNSITDSLKTELANAKEDTTRILLMNEMAAALQKTNKDSSLHLLQSAIPLAEKINFKAGLFELWFTQGLMHINYRQLDSALFDLNVAKGIAKETKDKVRLVRVLNAMSYAAKDPRSAISYLTEALAIESDANDKYRKSAILTSLGTVYIKLAEYDTAEIHYEQALAIQEELGDKKIQANILRNLGNCLAQANNLKKALIYYERSALLKREMGDKSGEAAIHNLMGFSYNFYGNFPMALEQYQTALKLMEEAKDKAGTAGCCAEISNLYVSMKDYPQALIYIEKSLKLWEEMGGEIQKSDLLFRKGDVYMLQKDYVPALLYLNESKAAKKAIHQTISADHYYRIGYSHEQLNHLDSALFFYDQALQDARKSNLLPYLSKSLNSLGNVHFQQGKISQAEAEIKEAYESASASGNKEQEMEAAEMLYRIYKKQNNALEALRFLEIANAIQDSVFNVNNNKEIARLEAGFEFEKEKQELEFAQEKELEQQANIRRMMWAALAVAGLILFIGFRYYRSKQKANAELSKLNEQILKQKEKLEELDVAKSRFFTNISHEFRTPLTIISGMIDQIDEKPDLWLKRGAKMIKQNTVGLLNLVNQILDLRKLESNELKVNMVQGDVVKYLRYITESHKSYVDNKGLQLHFLSAQSAINMDYDPDKLLRIVSNLLSNAIKFTSDGGNVYFQINKNFNGGKPMLNIRVQDTGAGIPGADLPHIFGRFYQVDDSATRRGEGTGIGLALTKELVKLLGGEIGVESKVGEGTTFQVDLPITEKSDLQVPEGSEGFREGHGLENVIVTPELVNPELEAQRDLGGTDGKPQLLIVEDNLDVQQYLVACLGDDYQITVAENGQIGIDKAIEQVPDLIVSDVMMPEKDGYELTETLKNDERTDHIPIVLLTAKADMDSKISGLEKGADAYLAKPFDKRELLVRLEKLLELRKKLQARYAQFTFSENAPSQIEDPFLQKFYALVEKELSNPELDMNQLCRSMGMSRSQVFRKLKALTGKSATIFIRSIRLQHAKKLLATTNLTVSEIAYEVGFSTPSYFSTAFLEEFGTAPSATRN